jgi:NAD(P)-dependent dehydrogenase (short-subunit alcohol dehydrogenase family)
MLKDRGFLVAGAAGLLGTEIVISLLDKGAFVLAADLNMDMLKDSLSSSECDRLKLTSLDITNEVSINSALDACKSAFGRVDGSVNAAYPKNKNYGRHVFDVEYSDFAENLGLHLGGSFLFIQQCADFSRRHSLKFSLVNISSIYGHIAPRFDIYAGTEMTMPVEYAAIKAGLNHLNKYFTKYMAGSQFRTNCLSLGGLEDQQPEEFLEKYKSYCVSKGMLSVKDVTQSVGYLLSDDSEFVKGQDIIIDDGFSV